MARTPPASTIMRHEGKGGRGGRTYLPPIGHGALSEARTIYPSGVHDPSEPGDLLKSGHHNPKVGAKVTKGPWAGMPIYTLALEERATCPPTCRQWRACMGNNMPFQTRWRHGEDFEFWLQREIAALQLEHPRGFVVRLHVLGDFYSVGYVTLWRAMMGACPALHVFGFTARIDVDDPITQAIARIRREHRARWWVRFSDAGEPVMSTEIVDLPEHASPGSIVCPQQTGKTLSCGTCGLCWASTTNITWLRH